MATPYFEKVDRLMHKRGYCCGMIAGHGTDEEVRYYGKMDSEHDDKITVQVTKGKQFKFVYRNIRMVGWLQTDWMSPINDNEHFEKMYKKFAQSVIVLRGTWGDW